MAKLRDRVKAFRRVSAKELLRNPKNYRTHPQGQQDALRGILAEVGIAGALVAYETPEGLQLIDGHLRADTEPDTKWPVIVLDVTEAEAAKLLATLDPLAAMAEIDAAKLEALLGNVETENDGLAKLLADLEAQAIGPAPEVSEDTIPEPPKVPVTKPGDLWLLGEHRLLCGDSRNAADVARLMDGNEINIAFTSPPYASQRKYDEASGFKPIPPAEYVDWWEAIQANIKAHLAGDGSFFVNIKEHCEEGQRHLYVKDLAIAHVRRWGWLFVDEFCWKRPGMPMKQPNRFKNSWEPVYHFATDKIKFRPQNVMEVKDTAWRGDGGVNHKEHRKGGESVKGDSFTGGVWASNVIEVSGVESGIKHNAMFPVALPAFFIKAYTDKGDWVFDCFMGSGSTMVAAEKTGRRSAGMEISPAYCDVIVARWEALTGKKATREKAKKRRPATV